MKRHSSPQEAAETHITSEARHSLSGIRESARAANGVPVNAPALETRGAVSAWLRFWFTPADPGGLHVIRILAGLLFLSLLLFFAGYQEDFFALTGWFDAQAYRETAGLAGGSPIPFSWSILYLCGNDAALLNIAYWGSIAVLLLFTLGIATRITSILTWVIVVSFTANPVIRYDADALLVLLAFYLMLGYVLLGLWSRPLSWLERIFGAADGGVLALFRPGRGAAPLPASYAANLALRLLQVHFALVVVTCGLHKLQYGDWWAGAALWYPMHPPLQTTFDSIKTTYPMWRVEMFVLSLAAYATLAWQIAFPLFAWRKRWRLVLVGGGLLGWIGSIFVLRLPLFGPIFLIATLSYLIPREWRNGINWAGNLFQGFFSRVGATPAGAAHKTSKVGT